jgi:hypothetical protein
MNEEIIRQIREAMVDRPAKPDLESLIESGDLIKVPRGYQAPTKKGQEAIKGFVTGYIVSNKGKPLVYQLSIRRKGRSQT